MQIPTITYGGKSMNVMSVDPGVFSLAKQIEPIAGMTGVRVKKLYSGQRRITVTGWITAVSVSALRTERFAWEALIATSASALVETHADATTTTYTYAEIEPDGVSQVTGVQKYRTGYRQELEIRFIEISS